MHDRVYCKVSYSLESQFYLMKSSEKYIFKEFAKYSTYLTV